MRTLNFMKQKFIIDAQLQFHETCDFGFNNIVSSVMTVFN
jgi:hypothetical protein